MFWVAGEVELGAWVVAGFTIALIAFALIARLAVRLAAAARGGGRGEWGGRGGQAGIGWRYGLASLERRASASVVQIVALSLGFMALLLLTAIRGDLLDAWRGAVPVEAPNRFVINIQPEQVAPVRARMIAEGLSPDLAPMVRGRLTRINDLAVSAASYTCLLYTSRCV